MQVAGGLYQQQMQRLQVMMQISIVTTQQHIVRRCVALRVHQLNTIDHVVRQSHDLVYQRRTSTKPTAEERLKLQAFKNVLYHNNNTVCFEYSCIMSDRVADVSYSPITIL